MLTIMRTIINKIDECVNYDNRLMQGEGVS